MKDVKIFIRQAKNAMGTGNTNEEMENEIKHYINELNYVIKTSNFFCDKNGRIYLYILLIKES